MSFLSGPIIFVSFGFVMGPGVLGFLELSMDNEFISVLAEFTLALILFSDASLLKVEDIKKNIKIPERLLKFGLPLTILLGLFAAKLIFTEFSWLEALILAVILAPTDAALGKPVVSNKAIPKNIRIGLSIESGLNDGLCVPILLICFAFTKETTTGGDIVKHLYFLRTIGIGVSVGCGLALLGSLIVKIIIKARLANASWIKLIPVTLAITIFSLAQLLGGSGFIACFSGGVLFGILARRYNLQLGTEAEGIGDVLSLITWVVFGAVIVAKFFSVVDLSIVFYALLSLTLVRMIPVSLSLTRLKINHPSKLFIGWFGPRGLASIVFIIMALKYDLPHIETIAMVGVGTILMSVVLHGLSANALINKYADSLN